MTKTGNTWNAAAMCQESEPDASHATFALLSRQQKREIAGLTAMAIVSTTLIVTAWIISSPLARHDVHLVRTDASLDSPPVRDLLPETVGVHPLPRDEHAVAPLRRRAARVAVIARVPAEGRTHRRLARFLFGDGRYRVRPFPSVASDAGSGAEQSPK